LSTRDKKKSTTIFFITTIIIITRWYVYIIVPKSKASRFRARFWKKDARNSKLDNKFDLVRWNRLTKQQMFYTDNLNVWRWNNHVNNIHVSQTIVMDTIERNNNKSSYNKENRYVNQLNVSRDFSPISSVSVAYAHL